MVRRKSTYETDERRLSALREEKYLNISLVIQMVMKFSEDEINNADRVQSFFNMIIGTPRTDAGREVEKADRFNPLFTLKNNTLFCIYSGSRPLAQKMARQILGRMDTTEFGEFLDSLRPEQKKMLIEELETRGFHTTPKKLTDYMKRLICRLLQNIAEGTANIIPEDIGRCGKKYMQSAEQKKDDCRDASSPHPLPILQDVQRISAGPAIPEKKPDSFWAPIKKFGANLKELFRMHDRKEYS